MLCFGRVVLINIILPNARGHDCAVVMMTDYMSTESKRFRFVFFESLNSYLGLRLRFKAQLRKLEAKCQCLLCKRFNLSDDIQAFTCVGN